MFVLVLLSVELLLLNVKQRRLLLLGQLFLFLSALFISLTAVLYNLIVVLLPLFVDDNVFCLYELTLFELIWQTVKDLCVLQLLVDFWNFTLVDDLIAGERLHR